MSKTQAGAQAEAQEGAQAQANGANGRKVRILFIAYTQTNGGGAEAVLTTLVNAIDKNKYECTIQEIDRYHVKNEPLCKEAALRPMAIRDEVPMYRWCNHINSYFLHNRPEVLSSLFDLDGYDAAVSWDYQTPSFLMLGVRARNKIAWFHTDVYFLDTVKHPDKIAAYKDQIEAWQDAQRIVGVSNNELKSLCDVFPMYASKGVIIHNGTSIERILNMAKEETISFGGGAADREGTHLVCAGRLDKRKNFILAIEAVTLLRQEGFNVMLHILGRGEMLEAWQERARTLGIEDAVVFHGYIQNPYPYILAADILCITSLSEGWGMVACEAMALGKPFVTTPVAGASEELAEGGRCGLVAKWDAADYAQKIKTLIEDKQLYHAMSARCKEHVKEYSVERAAETFDALIDTVRSEGALVQGALQRTRAERTRLMASYALRLISEVRGKAQFLIIVQKMKRQNIAVKACMCVCAAAIFASWMAMIVLQAPMRLVQMHRYIKAVRAVKGGKSAERSKGRQEQQGQ